MKDLVGEKTPASACHTFTTVTLAACSNYNEPAILNFNSNGDQHCKLNQSQSRKQHVKLNQCLSMNLLTSDTAVKRERRRKDKSECELFLHLWKLSQVFKTASHHAALMIQLISQGVTLTRSTIYSFFCRRLFVSAALAGTADLTWCWKPEA